MPSAKGQSPEAVVRQIHRVTRRKFSAEEKIRIVLEGLRGEVSIAELCRREGINPNVYYRWSKDFLEAGFRELKSIEDFDFSFNPSIKRRQVMELATGRFIRDSADILILGPPGVGKSHLVQAIGHQAARVGFVVLYRSIFDTINELLQAENFGDGPRIMKQYLQPDLLIIDDMGIKKLPKQSGEYLFEIIMRRHELRSTIMTSNRPLDEWGKLIGDVPTATAILDRILQKAEIIQITGKSYRLKDQAEHKIKPGTEK